MRLCIALVWMPLLGCARGGPHVAATYGVSEVAEASTPPAGYVGGESVVASCSRAPATVLASEVTLDDVDCSAARLTRVLRAKAGELSARLIVDKRCRTSRQHVRCSAKVARATESAAWSELSAPVTPAPGPAEVLDLDEPRPQDGARIWVSLVPRGPNPALRARTYDDVAETRVPAVGRRALGEVSARCEDCRPLALHLALRTAAGRAGAGEISDVRCFVDSDGQRCVAVALEPWSF